MLLRQLGNGKVKAFKTATLRQIKHIKSETQIAAVNRIVKLITILLKLRHITGQQMIAEKIEVFQIEVENSP